MSSKVRDPDGKPLKRILLQVQDSDEQGPVSLRVRRDHEKIDLRDERNRTFLMVWVAEDQVLGELRLTDIIEEFETLKEINERRKLAKDELDRDLANLHVEVEKLEQENRLKTEELRTLQRERDPERMERMVAARIVKATLDLEQELIKALSVNSALRSEVAELRASKKKLREALERLKEGL